jgi:hypothetical protein
MAFKDFIARAGEVAQDWSERGFQVSKEFVNKAGAKAQNLGEQGVLMLEIKQLEGQAGKLIARLGTEVYLAFTERNASGVSPEDPAIRGILAELAALRETVGAKEAQLQTKKS